MIRRRYTAEYRAQAVELVNLGRSVPEVAKELGIGEGMLYRWVREDSPSGPLDNGELRATLEESAAEELRRLRRENANLKLENDILKKAAVILGTKAPSKGER